jgi:hypothetical protein
VGGTNQNVTLSSIPTCNDPDRRNIQRRVYRTQWANIGGGTKGGTFYRIATIDDNTTTTYTDTTADTGLVPDNAYTTDEFGNYVNGVPPKAKIGVVFRARLYLVDAENPNIIYVSRVDDIQAFPALYYLWTGDHGSGDAVVGFKVLGDRLFAWTESSIWEIVPTADFTTFSFNRLVPDIGAAGHQGIVAAGSVSYFWNSGDQKLWAFDGTRRPIDIGDPFRTTMRTLNQAALPYASGIYYQRANQIWWAVSTASTGSGGGETRIPNNDTIVCLQLDTGDVSLFTLPVNVLAMGELPDNEEDRPFGVDYFGFVNQYDTNDNDGYAETGDRYGTCNTGWTTKTGTLLAEDGLAATLDTTGDGLIGCEFRFIRAGTEYSARIQSNTSATVVLATALGATPQNGDVWWIAGIRGDYETSELDMEALVHFKMVRYLTLQHRSESGYTQGAATTNRMEVHTYQDGSTTASPDKQELDLTTPLLTGVPYQRLLVNRTGNTHRVRFYGPYPDEPWRIEGMEGEWSRTRRRVVAG